MSEARLTPQQIDFMKCRVGKNGELRGVVGASNKREPGYKTQLSLFRLGYIEVGFRIERLPVIYLTDKGYKALLATPEG